MNVMQQALLKANVINNNDLDRVKNQVVEGKEHEKIKEWDRRWNKALNQLPSRLAKTLRSLNKKYPDLVGLFIAETWADTFSYAKKNQTYLPPDFGYAWLRENGLIK